MSEPNLSWIKHARQYVVNGQTVLVVPYASDRCRVCGRPLTSERSIDRGVGRCCGGYKQPDAVIRLDIRGEK